MSVDATAGIARWVAETWAARLAESIETMTGERPTVTLHANLAPGAAHGEALWAIHTRLAQRLRVEHTTVQIEEPGTCQSPECGPSR